jgi:hypothetical protein
MTLLTRLFGRLRGFNELDDDQQVLEDLVVPLLVSLMAMMVLITVI